MTEPEKERIVRIEGHRYLSITDIMSALGMAERTVIRRIKESGIPEYTFGDGRTVRYRESDVASLIKRREK